MEETDAIDEELFRQAVKLILGYRKASVSLLQRKLKIGFARAGRLIDKAQAKTKTRRQARKATSRTATCGGTARVPERPA